MKKQFEKPEVVVICFTKETITSASGYSANGVYDGGGSGWTDFGGQSAMKRRKTLVFLSVIVTAIILTVFLAVGCDADKKNSASGSDGAAVSTSKESSEQTSSSSLSADKTDSSSSQGDSGGLKNGGIFEAH